MYFLIAFMSWLFTDPLNIVKDIPKSDIEKCRDLGKTPVQSFGGRLLDCKDILK